MKKILVVDNHPVMLKFMTNLLEKEGHEVLTAQDGLSALDILKKHIPDVMFVDLVMPNIAGEKLCRIVRSMPGMSDVYVVILSGIAAEKDLDFKQLGADACIAKGPFNKMAPHVLFTLEQSDLAPPRRMPNGVIGLDDVYEREVTRELLSSKRHLERILDNMSEGIIELNPEARIVNANPAAVSLIGIPEEMLLSQSFTELFHETHREGIKNLIDEGSGDVQHTIGEDSPLILNGKRILLNILQLKGEDQKAGIIIMNDISERKRIEAQLRQAQKMESIATLAGGIAHQFNNALSVITGNIELLKMSSPEDNDNAEYTEPIKNAAYRMAHLTSQLLAYARGGKYNPKTMSLSAFIEDTLPLIRHSINPEILMESNLPQLNYNIEADFTQMQMVLSALVSNAAEAIEGKGCIRITSAIEDIVDHHAHLEPGCYACLSVEDDGKGMDEGIKNRMFEPFFTTNFQGRGLGMAAVYGIIQNHGGWISVDSELEKGTLVQLYLPAVEAVEKGMKEKESQLEEGSGTILIIEDEDMILEVCRTMLEKLNYRVLEARTGEEAINIVRTFDGDIDLSILDIGLPDMDGDKLYPLLKEARTDLKVIVCSGYAIDGPAQGILDAGAQGFIQKPYAFGMLSDKLKELLGG
ncbi:MAG: response regulator [Deltaproteobacteria bacterium]|nr:response regulator [Deltaproteobacteria bacterium]